MSMKNDTIFKTPPQFVEDEQGNRKVILDEGTFKRIIDELEDIYDNVLIDEVRGEPVKSAEEVFRKEDKRRYGNV